MSDQPCRTERGTALSIAIQDFAVPKASQAISLAALTHKTLPPQLRLLPRVVGPAVSFTTTTPSACTSGGTNGATITLVTTGTCTVQANQAGNAIHAAATAVNRNFRVSNGWRGLQRDRCHNPVTGPRGLRRRRVGRPAPIFGAAGCAYTGPGSARRAPSRSIASGSCRGRQRTITEVPRVVCWTMCTR